MGSGVVSVRVGRAVGRALALGVVSARRSEGVGGRNRPTTVCALASGAAGESPLSVVLPESGTAGATGTEIIWFWLFSDSMGGNNGVRSTVCSGGSEGVVFGWQQHWWQLGRWSRSRQRLLASAGESTSGKVAGERVGVRASVSKSVGVRDGRVGSDT